MLTHRPCIDRLLKVPQGAITFYDYDEYERLVAAAARIDRRALLTVLLGRDAGLRAGEMRAPEWTDVIIRMTDRPAYLVEEGDSGLTLTLYGTKGPVRRQKPVRAAAGSYVTSWGTP